MTLKSAWVELSFALVTAARERQDQTTFTTWMERLKAVVGTNSNWQARLNFESCMFFLSRGMLIDLRKALDQWSVRQEEPIWRLRRASILAELGDIDKAHSLAEEALQDVRARQLYGPVYRQPWSNPTPIMGRDQLSVHTSKAATLLIQGMVGIWEERGDRRWYRVTP